MAFAALAQQPSPHAGYVYPAGGRQGAVTEVTIGGQFLDGAAAVLVSGGGIEASVIEHTKPMTALQINRLREQLKELMEKKPPSPEDSKAIAELRLKIASAVRRPVTPAIAETVRVRISIEPDAAPGERELRLSTPTGLTNPLLFHVGQLPEHSEPAARPPSGERSRPSPASTTSVTLPAVLNGQITPGGVDRYRFQASKGLRLVAAASARRLIPYISDAVPGWFQAVLTLSDANGKQLAYADDFRFHPDPVLFYEIPADGEYVLSIRDSLYRGREDFVYRITAGELPFITSVFPLGAKAGSRTTLELAGWNLPAQKITQVAKETAICLRSGEWLSNQVPFAVDTLPESFEKEPNQQARQAQAVKLPVIMNGRIRQPGDWDVYRFQGRAGAEIAAEVLARRLGSPLDSVLKLTDSAGRQIAFNDDHEDKGAGLTTHHADSWLIARLPKNGTYYLHVGDAQNRGGEDYAYRLRISPPRPDFELRLAPSSLHARAGASVPVTVYALRKDGFSGEISLELKDAPRGFALSGARIPAGQDKTRLTLTVPATRLSQPVRLRLEGRAAIQGKRVSRSAVPAEDMMQAFFYHHLVPAQEWVVQVPQPARFRTPWKLASDDPVRLPAGGTAPVRLEAPRGPWMNQVQFALNDPPEGVAIEKVAPGAAGLEILLRADSGKIKPGLQGNLIVDVFTERIIESKDGKQTAGRRRLPLGMLPAIPFEIVSR